MNSKNYDLQTIQRIWPKYVKARDEIFYSYFGSDWSEEYLKLPPMLRYARRQILLNGREEFETGRFALCREFEDDLICSLENVQDRKYILFDMNCIAVQCELSKGLKRLYPDEYKGSGVKGSGKIFCRRYELKVISGGDLNE